MQLSLHRTSPTVPHECFQCLIQSATLQRPNQAALLIAVCEINYGKICGIDVTILLHCLGKPTVFVSLMSPGRCHIEERDASCQGNKIAALWAKNMLLQHTNLSLLLMTTMPVHNCISERNMFCFALLDRKIFPAESVNRSPIKKQACRLFRVQTVLAEPFQITS